jgi:hypothetical protein
VDDDLGVSLKLPPPFECAADLLRVLRHPPSVNYVNKRYLARIISCLTVVIYIGKKYTTDV